MKFQDAKDMPKPQPGEGSKADQGRIATKDAVKDAADAARGKSENKMSDGSRPDQRRGRGNASTEVVALAKESNVDLNTIQGSGAGGEITIDDVNKAKDSQSQQTKKTNRPER